MATINSNTATTPPSSLRATSRPTSTPSHSNLIAPAFNPGVQINIKAIAPNLGGVPAMHIQQSTSFNLLNPIPYPAERLIIGENHDGQRGRVRDKQVAANKVTARERAAQRKLLEDKFLSNLLHNGRTMEEYTQAFQALELFDKRAKADNMIAAQPQKDRSKKTPPRVSAKKG
jgi:hypothetical protein